jgi:hypothetical protein
VIHFHKWPSIVQLLNVVHHAKAKGEAGLADTTIHYKSKVKLDGTNAAVVIDKEGNVFGFQSRTQFITPTNDNAGFAGWASKVTWPRHQPDGLVRIIHGEWFGPGIQSGTACQKLPRKMFGIFCIERSFNRTDSETGEASGRYFIMNPEKIAETLKDWSHPDVFIIPWHCFEGDMTLSDEDSVALFADRLNKEVLIVENRDPFVYNTFGIEGVGEGLVLYPTHEEVLSLREVQNLVFKAKGEKHRAKAAKVAAEVNPTVLNNVNAFVDTFVTDVRCQQGLTEACGGVADMKKLGAFLKWMGADVEKESKVELAANGMVWKDVSAAVTAKAKGWFQSQQ